VVVAVLLQSLGLATGGILSVGQWLLTLILLSTEGGRRKALAYYAGMSTVFHVVAHGALVVQHRSSSSSARPGLAPLVLGVVFLALAVVTSLKTRQDDGPPRRPKFFSALDEAGPLKLYAFGAFVGCFNFKNLSLLFAAVAVVADGQLPAMQAHAVVTVTVVAFLMCILGPILVDVVVGRRSQQALRRLRAFLERNTRPLSVGLLLLFGVLFSGRGLWLMLHG